MKEGNMNPKLYSWLIIVCQTQFHVNICLLFHSISLLHLYEHIFQSLQQRQDLPLVVLLHATISLSSFCLWGINFFIYCTFSMDLNMPRPQKTLLYYITTIYNKLSFYQQFFFQNFTILNFHQANIEIHIYKFYSK